MTDQTQVPEGEPAPVQPLVKSRSEIARELFGDQYKGEVTPASEIEEPKPVNTEAEEVPPTEEEPSESGEPEEGTAETAPEEAEGETPIATLSELADHYGLDREYLNTLKVEVNVDGTPTEATIGDLVRSHQMSEAAEHRLELAKEYQAKQGEAWAAKHAELENHFQVIAELIKVEEANLERDIKAIPPELREQDPAEWSARVQEFNARRGQIAQTKAATIRKYQEVAEAREREGEAIKNQYMQDQHQVLLDKLPEWKDPKRAEVEKAELANYLVQTGGFSPMELADLLDHRQVMIARKAMLYDKSRGQVDTAKKRVASVPKMMKSGAPKPAEQRQSERIASLHAKAKKSGSLDDAIAYRMAKRGVR